MYKPPIILYNYTIFYAFCSESVYKIFRKRTLNKPAAGGKIGQENRGSGQPNKPQKGNENENQGNENNVCIF